VARVMAVRLKVRMGSSLLADTVFLRCLIGSSNRDDLAIS
jgi:hypothetical protein